MSDLLLIAVMVALLIVLAMISVGAFVGGLVVIGATLSLEWL